MSNKPHQPISDEIHQLQAAIENLPANVFITNAEYEIVYANGAAREALLVMNELLADELNIQHGDVLGQYLDVFFTDPLHGSLPDNLDALPHQADATLGRVHLRFQLAAIHNTAGKCVGAIVHWADVTADSKQRQEQADHAANTRAISHVVRSLAQTNSLQQVASAVLNVVQQSFGWTYGVFWGVDSTAGRLQYITDSGSVAASFREFTSSATFSEGGGLPGRAWQQQDVVFAPSIGDVAEGIRASAAGEAGIVSGISVPILVNQQVTGVLEFLHTHKLQLSSDRAQTLRAIAGMMSLALQRISDSSSPTGFAVSQDIDHLAIVSRAAREGVEDLADGSKSLSDFATQHAAGIDEALGSLQTLSSLSDRTVDLLQRVSYTAASANATVDQSLAECSHATERASSSLAELAPAVDFIKRFEEIAFRMKLLAVNGGIEASRVGQSGQGFVIITEEMRSLSREASQIANDALEAIERIRRELQGLLNHARDGRNSIESASREVTEIASALDTITGDSQTQHDGITQLINDISEFDRLLRQNADDAEDFSLAAEETAHQLASLRRLVEGAMPRNGSCSDCDETHHAGSTEAA